MSHIIDNKREAIQLLYSLDTELVNSKLTIHPNTASKENSLELIESVENNYKEEVHKTSKLISKLIDQIEMKQGITDRFLDILKNFTNISAPFADVKYESNGGIISDFRDLYNIQENLSQCYYLTIIDSEKNAVIIGANGSGKSSFASFFKSKNLKNVAVIPARKNLYVNNNALNQNYTFDGIQIPDIQSSSNIKYKDQGYRGNSEENMFSLLIVALTNDTMQYYQKYYNKEFETYNEDSIFNKFKGIFIKLMPDISFTDVDNNTKQFQPIKNGIEYTINEMSEGERIIIYFILQVLLAEKKAIIIVDEPELHLNASLYNRLWNELESIREDCRFIYISHRVDFIENRLETDFIWCKEFDYPENWIIEVLDPNETDFFPRELLLELTGAKKNIIFCEGTKDSIDYSIYSALFQHYSVIPVGSSLDVQRYTRLYNNGNLSFENSAFGIIDSDLLPEEAIEKLALENIIVTPYLEIEMLLCDESVIKSVLNINYDDSEINDKFKIFVDKFAEKLVDRKEKIIQRRIKKKFENILSNIHYDTKFDITDNIERLTAMLNELNQDTQSFIDHVETILSTRNYDNMLRICTLEHEEILQGLGNRIIDNNYQQKAQNHIKRSTDLQNHIREKYFSRFGNEISE